MLVIVLIVLFVALVLALGFGPFLFALLHNRRGG